MTQIAPRSTESLELDAYRSESFGGDELQSAAREEQIGAQEDQQPDGRSLEPADGGKSAWSLLIAGFIFEGILWGFLLSFGIFQNHYSQLPQFAGNPYISIVGTVATGINYMGAPLMMSLIQRNLKNRKYIILIGWIVCLSGLVGGSFANNFGSLVLTQGVLYGLGYILIFFPIISFTNEWWIQRRGMALGILFSSSGASGLAMPFIVEALLDRYGYKTTLRAMAVGIAVLTAPLLPLIKGRLPQAAHEHVVKADWSFLRSPLFYVFSLSNVLQGLGYFFPSLYLPSYASAAGLSASQGALLLALTSFTQVLGNFAFGWASDKKISLPLLIMVSTIVSAVSALGLWGPGHDLGLLIPFALVYGFFAPSYNSMWAYMSTTITQEPSSALPLLGMFAFGKGVGNVLAGPISAGLLQGATIVSEYGIARYRSLIVFTGATMFASAACVAVWQIQKLSLAINRHN